MIKKFSSSQIISIISLHKHSYPFKIELNMQKIKENSEPYNISFLHCFCIFIKISLLVLTIQIISVIYNFEGSTHKSMTRKINHRNHNESNNNTISIDKKLQHSIKNYGIQYHFISLPV